MFPTSPIGPADDIPVYLDDPPLFLGNHQIYDLPPTTEEVTCIRNRTIIENSLRYSIAPEQMVNLTTNLIRKIHIIETCYTHDKNLLREWLSNETSRKEKCDHIAIVVERQRFNMKCIETLETLLPFFHGAFTNLKTTAKTLRLLNTEPNKETVSLFKNTTLKSYEESKKALDDEISKIAQSLIFDKNFYLYQGHGAVYSAEQEGTMEAINVTIESEISLEIYEKAIRDSLACIEMTFETTEK